MPCGMCQPRWPRGPGALVVLGPRAVGAALLPSVLTVGALPGLFLQLYFGF